MDLQTVFYIIAIVAFTLFIVLMLTALYFIFFIKKVIENTQRQVMSKIIEYTKPVDVVKGIASSVVSNILMKFKDGFSMKSKDMA